jgi:predicted MFS family arabinose efflux permease
MDGLATKDGLLTDTRKAWAVTIVIVFASIVVAMSRFKVPPILPVLMDDLHLDMVMGGWLMSVYSVTAIMLAIPAALLLGRLGAKVTGLIALGCTLAGNLVGAVAPNATWMLVGRVVEGISLGLITVVAPAVISMWFARQDRGLPLGIWTTWVPVGNVLAFTLAPRLLDAFGWRASWWLSALLAAIAFLLYALVVTTPPRLAQRDRYAALPPRKLLFKPTIWLLSLAFGALGFSLMSYNTWAPTFLHDTLQIDAASASFYASLLFLAGIPANIIAGWVQNRSRNRNTLLTAVFVVATLLFFWSFRLESAAIVVPYMVVLGFVCNWIPTSIFTLAPDTMPGIQLAGLAVGIVTIGAQAGALFGPPAVGFVVSNGAWTAGSTLLVIVMAAGAVAAVTYGRKMRTI